MHSALVRLQSVFGFFTTVAFTVAVVIALSSFISPQSPSANIQLRNVQVVKGRPHYYSYKKEEYAHVRFDLEAGTFALPPLCTVVSCCADLIPARFIDPLQLEHQASLPVPQGRVPVVPRIGTCVRSHHLGRHSRVGVGALEPEPLRAPDILQGEESPPQEIEKGARR
jgi:hypothetical protein